MRAYHITSYMQKCPTFVPRLIDLVAAQMLPKRRPRAKFCPAEDEMLRQLVREHGENAWELIASKMTGRNVRQVKERWMTYLSPALNNGPFTPEEDQLLLEKHRELGPKWVKIAKFFQGRTDTSIKNRFIVLKRKMKALQAQQDALAREHVDDIIDIGEFFEPTSPAPVEDCDDTDRGEIQTDLWNEILTRCDAFDWSCA